MILLRYKGFFFFNIMIICFSSLFLSGVLIFLLRNRTITRDTMELSEATIGKLAEDTERRMSVIEQTLLLLNRTVQIMDLESFAEILDKTVNDQELIRAIYILDSRGETIAVGTAEERSALHSDYLGIDFSNTSLYQALQAREGLVWSDLFVSVLSGDTSVGVGVGMKEYSVIGELSLQALLGTLVSINDGVGRLWVIDGRGEILADTENDDEAGILNVRTVPFMQKALKGEKLDSTIRFENRAYHMSYGISRKLGWLFLWGTPAGIYNQRILMTLYDILLVAVSFLMVALILSPLWIGRISTDVGALRLQAEAIAENRLESRLIHSRVIEFRDLSTYMYEMHGEIRAREGELKELNRALESRVQERTTELQIRNEELLSTLSNLQSMQDSLVQSEKLAALGRMVAGVAHELNTPVGNSVMALSSLQDEFSRFKKIMEEGITKEEFDKFVRFVEKGVDISYRNVQRAAELITSFKHVANDQTSSIRRDFELLEIVKDVLITLHPMIKKTNHDVEVLVPEGIEMNSYPGVVVQILTNLINNAFYHAWEKKEGGLLTISAERITPPNSTDSSPWIEISVKDNGKGIPSDLGKRIFDPFYTSRAGRGGTGLGLNIALNGARKILGGSLTYSSISGEGTVFLLTIPLSAPLYT
ncbi:MAG: ATP-binding protein [Spirochaetales bacterium]|nr:ATP-binding protein [Spirochaetales bacterium]